MKGEVQALEAKISQSGMRLGVSGLCPQSANLLKTLGDWHFTKVYVREAEQWRVISFQASDSPAP
jgi:hypothetical protein